MIISIGALGGVGEQERVRGKENMEGREGFQLLSELVRLIQCITQL